MNPQPLFSLSRNGFAEIKVFGEIWTWDGEKSFFHNSDLNSRFPARSLLKPFQFVATDLGSEKKNEPWYVAALGSISGNKQQMDLLFEWIQADPKLLALVSHLKLPVGLPMDEKHRCFLKERGEKGSPWFHTCFSKHLAILKASQNCGWDLSTYQSTGHPYHQRLSQVLERFLGDNLNSTPWVTDGCRLPTPVLRMEQMAKLFHLLANSPNKELETLRNLMTGQPEWVGGPERVDTRLMEYIPGKIVAKEGADGLLGIGVLPNDRFPKGLGIIIKIASGYQPQWAGLAAQPFLEVVSKEFPVPIPEGQNLIYHFDPDKKGEKKWFDLSPSLHGQTPVWPGDISFDRKVSMDVGQGDHMSLSAIETTLHVGSHTDAPSHFEKTGASIDQIDIQRYLGTCQVIQVKKEPHSVIEPEDISEVAIVAPRVLFKTNSFRHQDKFSSNFVALSVRLLEELAKQKVILVGIDTPSIDLFESKDLSAHHATARLDISILEGIDLDQVSSGTYDLIAIPLRIHQGDASPVRAVLIPQ